MSSRASILLQLNAFCSHLVMCWSLEGCTFGKELGSCPEIDEGMEWRYSRNVRVTSLDRISPFAVEPAVNGAVVADAAEIVVQGRIYGYSSFSSSYPQRQYQLPLVMVRSEVL